jgi:hypothetical protein
MLRIRLTNANQIYRNLVNGRYPIRSKVDLRHEECVSDGDYLFFKNKPLCFPNLLSTQIIQGFL